MLERYFPNFYGWLVWGGGFRTIRQAFILLVAALLVAGIVALGMSVGFYIESMSNQSSNDIPFPPMFSSGTDRTSDTPYQIIQHEVDRENALKGNQ